MLVRLKNFVKHQLSAQIKIRTKHKIYYRQWERRAQESIEAIRESIKGTNYAKEQALQWLVSEKITNHSFSLLDVGCGPGLMRAVLERHPLFATNVRYTGVDQSEAAINFAKSEFAGKGVFQRLDIEYDELPTNPFDVIMINGVIEHTGGYKKLIDKCLKLKPKIFILSTFAVTHRVSANRLRWNPSGDCFMNIYPFADIYKHLRENIDGAIFISTFGPGKYNPEDYWFPHRGGCLFYCRLYTENRLMVTDQKNPPSLD
jgi:2-polyprenyl-3-methyl-5-hydroxy-6-metoxy-1,4-benzoquinol methylase